MSSLKSVGVYLNCLRGYIKDKIADYEDFSSILQKFEIELVVGFENNAHIRLNISIRLRGTNHTCIKTYFFDDQEWSNMSGDIDNFMTKRIVKECVNQLYLEKETILKET